MNGEIRDDYFLLLHFLLDNSKYMTDKGTSVKKQNKESLLLITSNCLCLLLSTSYRMPTPRWNARASIDMVELSKRGLKMSFLCLLALQIGMH